MQTVGLEQKGISYLDTIASKYSLTEEQSGNHDRLVTLKTMLKNALDNHRNLHNLDETEQATLKELAEKSNGLAANQARAILIYFYDYDYQHIINLEGISARPLQPRTEPVVSEASQIRLSPNPTQVGWVQVDYNLTADNANLMLISANGIVLQQQTISQLQGNIMLDVSAYPSGIYFVYLQVAGQKPIAQKLIINK